MIVVIKTLVFYEFITSATYLLQTAQSTFPLSPKGACCCSFGKIGGGLSGSVTGCGHPQANFF